ncbi:MAG TPA: GMC family oxidoreductase [Acidobacteriaceae bacterium]|jgi:choline dehydrogenase-like flavoprotein|nr:GMC family oxidoreductase [Acidobacteriaceae bacterium]
MIRDLLRGSPAAGYRPEVCVVGAGAAGICLAVELARRGKSVMVLEGGGREIEEAAQEPYRSEVVGHVHRGIHEGRFRAHGGTTTRWGGQILELNAEDFERREWVAESGWPFSRAELEPFYQRALEFEGLGGAMVNDADVWRRIGIAEPQFPAMQTYLTRWCPEPNFARLHGKTLETRENVQVWLHANAVELLLDDERVRGLRCRTQSGREMVVEAKEFIFCMGAIECVRFFLQPREGGLPWNRSGMLGRHFQDHIDANAAKVRPRDRKRFARIFDNIFVGGYKYHPKLRLRMEEQRSASVLNCAATMSFESEMDEALGATKTTAKHLLRGRWGEVRPVDMLRSARHAPLLVRQTLRYALQHRAYNPAQAEIRLRVHCEQQPDGESSITLAEERDSLGLLRARLDWRISELELRTIRYFAEAAAGSLADVAEVEVDEALAGADASFLERCDDSNHHMGGMRMAASAGNGVVTPELRLHGTRNAYVCSSAVFPTSGFSNPTHTVIALAMRLAEELARS